MRISRADLSRELYSYYGSPSVGLLQCAVGPASSSLDASITAVPGHTAACADGSLTAGTRFDPQSEPAGSAWAERATSRLGRAAASRGHPIPGSVTLSKSRVLA